MAAHYKNEVMNMSYIAPAVQAKFETLSIDLKNEILERNVQINTIYDLISVLEEIVNEGNK
jgi:disulfide oxidoreductase YuzD